MAKRLLKTALAAVAGLIAGYVLAVAIGLIAFEVLDVSDREGANAMGLAFVISPVVALIAALAAGIFFFITSGRAPSGATRRALPRWTKAAGAALAGFLAGLLLQWLLAGQSYETWIVAFVVSIAPWIGALLLGSVTLAFTRHPAGSA